MMNTQKIRNLLLLSFSLYFLTVNILFAEDVVKKVPTDGGGSYYSIGPFSLKKMLQKKDFLFINVHIPYEGEIKGTDLFIPYNEIQKNLNKLPLDKNAKIVLYCRTNRMSIIAVQTLATLGYSNLWSLEGGMEEWKKAGFPLINTRDIR